MAGVLARARLVVANDSGPRHLGAALGTPTVGVYWVGNVINAGPLLRARHRVAVSFRTTCPACGAEQYQVHAQRCDHDDSFVADVTPDEVLEHARDLLTEE
jgi:ADP-heptose:LPS heptosyltransferase